MDRRVKLIFAHLLIALHLPWSLPAAEQWLKLTTPNFELYTTAGEKRGRQTILYFEQVRNFFHSIGESPPSSPEPIRIVGFDSKKEFDPYRPRENVSSFSFSDRGRDTVVIEKLDSDAYPSAVYHYVNLMLRQTGVRYPLWLRIGIGDLYASLKPMAGKVQVGARREDYMDALTRRRHIDLEMLMTADQDSPLYTDRDQALLFYAQSWALTHMLQLSDQYRPRFPEFSSLLTSGASPAEAFQEVYGKPLEKVGSDLRGYVRGEWFKVAIFDTKLEKSAENSEVQPLSPVQAGLILVSLLRAPEKVSESAAFLEALAKENPSSWEIAEAQAYFVMQQNQNPSRASDHFEEAIRRGAGNPQLYYDYARLLNQSGAENEILTPLLTKAVALLPEYREARRWLVFLHYNQRQYPQALEQIEAMGTLNREETLELSELAAYSHLQLGQRELALQFAERARLAARSPEEVAAVEEWASHIPVMRDPERGPSPMADEGNVDPSRESADAPVESPRDDQRPRLTRRQAPVSTFAERVAPKPTAKIEGSLYQFDCLEDKARITILTGGRRVSFAILEPNAVTLTGATSATLDFSCGRQHPIPLIIEFEEKKLDGALGTTGVVRAIEFK